MSAIAQLNAGRIVGTGTDPSRAAVPQATVVVTEYRQLQRSQYRHRHRGGGRVTSTSGTPRQMQFALKYEF